MWGWYVGKFTSKCARIAEIEVSHGGPQEIFTSKCAKMVEIEVSHGGPQEIFTSKCARIAENEVSHGGPQEPKDHRKLKQSEMEN